MQRTLRVAAAQMRFAPTIEGNLAAIDSAVGRAAARGADAVLLPECAVTGYACDFRAIRRDRLRGAILSVGALARRHRVNVLAGSPVYFGGSLRNCLLVFDRAGRCVHNYAKCQLTGFDLRFFTPGDEVALFAVDGVPATAIICHERRYPELVRLGVMAGARVVFHPNAGLDPPHVSRAKRGGRDGIAVRAFENAVYYVFANSVGPQGGGLWSAGDSKIVAPDGKVLALAGNRGPEVIVADLDLSLATGRYAAESMEHPRFLRAHWRAMVREVRRRAKGGPPLP
jgi:predicted amidohydrolase